MTGSGRRTKVRALALAVAFLLASAASQRCAFALNLAPPDTLVGFTVESMFGRNVHDPYRWLEETGSPDVIAWFHAQNDYARRVLDALPGRAALRARLVQLIDTETNIRDVQSAGELLVYLKRAPEDLSFKLYLREGVGGDERLLLDPAQYDQDGQHAAIEYFSVSPNGRRLAVGVALGGSEDVTLRVIDVATRKQVGAPIPRARGAGPAWRYDGEVLFYTQHRARAAGEPPPEQFRNSRAFMRAFAPGGLERDTALLGSGLDPAIAIDRDDTPAVYVSPVSPFAIGVVGHGVQDEFTLYVAPLTQLRGAATPWRKLATADQGITDFDLRGEWIYLLTHENADRNQVVRWSLRDPQPYALADAEVVVAASDHVLRSVHVAKDALYVHESDGSGYDTLRRLEYNVKLKRVAAPATRGGARARVPKAAAALPKTAGIARGTELKLPYRGAIEEIVTDPQRAGALVRVAGWTEPPSYYSVDGKTGALALTGLLPRSGADWSAYAATDVTVKSHDGVERSGHDNQRQERRARRQRAVAARSIWCVWREPGAPVLAIACRLAGTRWRLCGCPRARRR